MKDQSLQTEILAYVNQVFANCNIASQYYPEEHAWRFQISFKTDQTYSFCINPPKGFCVMSVQALGVVVMFHLTLFVSDFETYHRKKALTRQIFTNQNMN